MGAKIDLTGQGFGKWTVVRERGRLKNGQVMWECICECGSQAVIGVGNLRHGSSTQCKSCSQAERNSFCKTRDITDIKFGMLKALSQTKANNGLGARWICECECGNFKEVRLTSLVSGFTKSCGCLRRERSRALMKEMRLLKAEAAA